MKQIVTLCFLVLLILASCSREMLGPATVQMPERLEAPDIALQHTYLAANDSLHLFLLFEDRRGVMDIPKTAAFVTYQIKSGKDERDALLISDTVQLGANRMVDAEGGVYASFSIPGNVVRSPNVVHVQVWQQLGKEERMGSLFQIPLASAMLRKRQALVDASTNRAIIRNYATNKERFKIIGVTDTSHASIGFVNSDFAPALPPMSSKADQRSRTLQIADTLLAGVGDTLQFEKEGLYLIWAGKPYAQGLLVQPWSYPYITMARELIAPLIYLTTSKEREKLYQAPDPKQAVDAFWQETAGNPETAREMIRLFYGRVEMANKLFTSHKAGWATDKGMVHIVFGSPNEVINKGLKEVWIYSQTRTRPHIEFVFTKKQNTFTENHYELVRLRDYQEVWYSTVAKWRAGITEI